MFYNNKAALEESITEGHTVRYVGPDGVTYCKHNYGESGREDAYKESTIVRGFCGDT